MHDISIFIIQIGKVNFGLSAPRPCASEVLRKLVWRLVRISEHLHMRAGNGI